MSEHDVRHSANVQNKAVSKPVFEVSSRSIANPHSFQFYVGYGVADAGPWAVVGLNETEYFFGYKNYEYDNSADARTRSDSQSGTVLNALVKTLA